jgi:replication factor C subunit 1
VFFFALDLSAPETTTAILVAQEAGRDTLEFNASDVRSKKSMQETLGDITGSQTLSFGAPSSKKSATPQKKKRVIIMDEVDGMGGGDRSGIAELIQMIKRSQVPIICICNDRQSQKIRSLVPYCMDLRYRRPVKSVIARRAMAVAEKEGLHVEANAAEAIAESCGNDVRQVLNALQMWASKSAKNSSSHLTYKNLKDRENSINKDAILRVSLFDAARIILEGRKGLSNADPMKERDSFFERYDAYFVDYSFVGLLVHQNYLKIAQGGYAAAQRMPNNDREIENILNRTALAAESMSDFVMAESSLRGGDQNWSLLPFTAVLSVKTGFHAGGPNGGFLQGFPEFTAWLGKNSTKGKKVRLLQELQHHMNYKISGGGMEMRLSYLPILRNRFLALLTSRNGNDAVDAAIDMMDEYGLDRDDVFEKLDEFRLATGKNETNAFANIDSKQKAAFTRAYNARAHMSQALVAEQGETKTKKSRGSGGGPSLDEPFDPDAIYDDAPPVNEEDEGDDDDDVEKLKSMFKKKGGRGSAASKGLAASKSKKRSSG